MCVAGPELLNWRYLRPEDVPAINVGQLLRVERFVSDWGGLDALQFVATDEKQLPDDFPLFDARHFVWVGRDVREAA